MRSGHRRHHPLPTPAGRSPRPAGPRAPPHPGRPLQSRPVAGEFGGCGWGRGRPRRPACRLSAGAGPDHRDTLTTRESLARLRGESGDAAGAADAYAKLLVDRERVLGPDHPDTLHARDWHAFCTGEAGDAAAARDLYADLLRDRTRVLGPDHPDTLHVQNQHARYTAEAE
ncbi:tetratricopeptide repeat protein [Streptomyces niveus]|uniref:tetratricopeptide repeat protein n=1 Tax=Streptomyces niveus TaxID=193462 RepID=UPI001FE23A32|nr:tetratricopeptide repeat protein [Streptomyces niveus]